MTAAQTEKKTFKVSIQVINIECPCGGACVNDRGSFMIEEQDKIVTCEECGLTYNVPESAFLKKVRKAAK